MTSILSRITLPVLFVAACFFATWIALSHPGYLTQTTDLGALIFLQLLVASVWCYRARFFPVLLGAFVWAAVDLPLNAAWTSGRWFVLAVGALTGLIIYTRDRQQHFSKFHLMAFFCVVASFASAAVSAYPNVAFLKAFSLALLFLYGSTGARLAVFGRQEHFFSRLLLGCEILVYFTAVSYFVLRIELFGNRNSLGAVMGVVAIPIMLWGVLLSENPPVQGRRTFALLLATALLFGSYARAGIAAAAVSLAVLCFSVRRYALLIKGLVAAVILAILVSAMLPLPAQSSASLSSTFLYKGKREQGILGSRKPVWDRTLEVIRGHPWFGSGFGTSLTSYEALQQSGTFMSTPEATREHGNSYLAITEWVGLVGGSPFFVLVIFVALNSVRALAWVRRTGAFRSPLVPLAAVLAAGLVHAAFEDWLFAVGYYLCVFFWALAFILVDLLPASAPGHSRQVHGERSTWDTQLGFARTNPSCTSF
jgi:O-antigen ligase